MSDQTATASDGLISHSKGYRAWVLFILVVVYTFNFIDRQIVGILAVPIKEDLSLSDTELSLMGGLAFALFYTLLGIPIAMLADRKSRTWIMTAALAIWSAMTAACGLAQNFWQLFLARLGVGVGEAGGVAPAYSLIADYFPPEKRARALAIYSFGIPIGSALGIILGGVLTTYLSWRQAFIIVGLLGVVISPIFRLTVKEPVRGGLDGFAGQTAAPLNETIRLLFAKPTFWMMSLGAASSSMAGYGLLFWLPSFFVRSFGESLPAFFSFMPDALIPDNAGPVLYASYFFGTILLVGGVAGLWMGGVISDRYGAARKSVYALIPGISFLVALPFYIPAILSSSPMATFLLLIIPQALSLVWLGPALTAFQHLVPPYARATASAIFLFINNLIGIGLGNLLIGAISDALTAQYGDQALRYAVLSGASFYFIAGIVFLLASRTIADDWVDNRAEQSTA